jgi:hypothetical protein
MRMQRWTLVVAYGLPLLIFSIGLAESEDAKPTYPIMAPIGQYSVAPRSEEIALAQSAAPVSIAGNADVLALGSHGYETAVKGKNGFVCVVERSWATDFDDAQFWNPKIRAPICFNAAAARSVLAAYLERSKWVFAGIAKSEMAARTKAAVTANTLLLPEPGAMCYMMSKQGYLNDQGGHWHPHLMFFVAHTDGAAWGADLDGSPVFAAQGNPEPITTFFVLVAKWSDGSPAIAAKH